MRVESPVIQGRLGPTVRSRLELFRRSHEATRLQRRLPLQGGATICGYLRGCRFVTCRDVLKTSKLQRRIVDDLLHDEERPGLAHTGKCDQLLSVKAIEVRNVSDADLQKVIEVACN